MKLKYYIAIARPDHWFKNIFMIPGMIIAIAYTSFTFDLGLMLKVMAGVFSTCLIASANYVINEWLDAEFDRYHPVKKNRPSVVAGLEAKYVYLEYALLVVVGLGITAFINTSYFWTSAFFLLMGFMYNVRPFRTKDKPYLDVISESINNPIRFALGWMLFETVLMPPSSLLIAYWMGGAFLMGIKRFAEYRYINNPEIAGLYRKSFQYYNEDRLLVSVFFYAFCTAFFLAIFLIKYQIELILSAPLFALLFAWYLKIAFKPDSPVQHPEKLYQERKFFLFILFLSLTLVLLVYINIPILKQLLEKNF